MPKGPGTYGTTRGRPPMKKGKKKTAASTAKNIAPADLCIALNYVLNCCL